MDRLSREKQLRRRISIGVGLLVAVPVLIIILALLGVFSSDKTAVYQPGDYTEAGYESKAIGYRFVTPKGCTLATEEELAKLVGMSNELLAGSVEDWELYYEKQATVYDMMATMPSGANVNVIWSRTEEGMDEQEMLAQVIAELESLDFMDVKVREGSDKATIAGREYTRIISETRMYDIDMIQEYYVSVDKGYCVSMTLTYYVGFEEDKAALINAFEKK